MRLDTTLASHTGEQNEYCSLVLNVIVVRVLTHVLTNTRSSGQVNINEYDDTSGLMGFSYNLDDGPRMCFNAGTSTDGQPVFLRTGILLPHLLFYFDSKIVATWVVRRQGCDNYALYLFQLDRQTYGYC